MPATRSGRVKDAVEECLPEQSFLPLIQLSCQDFVCFGTQDCRMFKKQRIWLVVILPGALELHTCAIIELTHTSSSLIIVSSSLAKNLCFFF